MIKFNINKENIKALTSIGNQLKDMASQTKTIFLPKENTMSVNLYSTKNAVTYSVDISAFSSDDATGFNYFSLSLPDICSAVEKVSKSGEDDISIVVDKTVNKITFTNPVKGTHISLATFNSAVSDEDAKSATTAVDDLYNQMFKDKSRDIIINSKVMSFFETAQGFMNESKRSNSIALNHSKARYADSFAIIEKDLGDDVSPYDTDTYIKKALIDFIKPLQKFSDSDSLTVSVTDTADRAYVNFVKIGLRAILSLEASSYAYPMDEEISGILPKKESCLVFDTTKTELLDAIKIFDGVFKSSNWSFSNVNLNASEEFISKGTIDLNHSDYSAECDTKCPITLVANTENASKSDIIISLSVISKLLNLVDSDKEKITFTMNSLSPSDVNGAGVKLTTESGLKAIAVKLLNNE